MGVYTMHFTLIIILLIGVQNIHSTRDDLENSEERANTSNVKPNQSTHRFDRNEIGDVNRSRASINENLSRVKRQNRYDPYSRRNRYPYPLPIFAGGGFGVGGFGGRGFGGRGFGGRGFGGRGFGGRGFGGRGIGGRGIGGFGGRGIGGGGRGGGRG